MTKIQTISTWAFLSLVPTISLAGIGPSSAPAPGLYVGGESSALINLLDSAKSTIDIEIYTMTSKRVREAIRAALKRKVHVRIIKDSAPMQDSCSVFPPDVVKKTGGASAASQEGAPASKASADCEDQRNLVTEVNTSGGAYIPYNKPALCRDNSLYCFEHGKIALVDAALPNAAALVSSGNFDDTNLCDSMALSRSTHCDRDYSVVTHDPAIVRSLSAVFQKDLAGVKYDLQSMLGTVVSKSVTVSPYSLDPLISFLKSAQHSVEIQEQYLKEPSVVLALVGLARSGKQVSIQVASACAFGKPQGKEEEEFRNTYSQLEEAGAKIRIFSGDEQIQGHTGYLHAKAIIVDGARAWVGSANVSTTSLTNNREYGLFLTDFASVSKLKSQMEKDFQDPRSETWQESLDCHQDPITLENQS